MANSTVMGPVREAHLANKLGLHPVVAAAGGTFFFEGGFCLCQRLHFLPDRLQGLGIESGANLGDVN